MSSLLRWLPAVAGVAFGIALVTFFAGRAMTGESQEGTIDVRYGNVILTVPKPGSSELTVAHNPPISDAQPRWRIQAYVEPPPDERDFDAEESWPTLEIDSETGEIVSDTLSAKRPDLAEPLLASLRVDASPPDAVWPYDASADPGVPQQSGDVSYLTPDPASGITVAVSHNLCAVGVSECVSQTLSFYNLHSFMIVSTTDARVLERTVVAEDEEAFMHLAGAVVAVGGTPDAD